MDQPGKVANPARGQLNRENDILLSPCVPENLVSRDGFSRLVPRQSAYLHTQAEPGMRSVEMRFNNRFTCVGVDISIYALLTRGRSQYLSV